VMPMARNCTWWPRKLTRLLEPLNALLDAAAKIYGLASALRPKREEEPAGETWEIVSMRDVHVDDDPESANHPAPARRGDKVALMRRAE